MKLELFAALFSNVNTPRSDYSSDLPLSRGDFLEEFLTNVRNKAGSDKILLRFNQIPVFRFATSRMTIFDS